MISIIVPVYNVERYLGQCLDGLTWQTYADIEIVCVNDGSTDASAGILAGYAARDSRVKVITQENGGISAARNRAVEEARGEWMMFVDSDDWIDAETCEKAMKIAVDYAADVVLWAYVREFEDGRQLPRPLMAYNKKFEGEELRQLHRKIVGPLGEELRDPTLLHSWGTVWGKLYRREVIAGTKFIDTRIVGSAEDVLFNVEVFGRAAIAVYINEAMYHYRKLNASFTGGYNARLNERWVNLYAAMSDVINREGLGAGFREALDSRIALGLIGQGLNECKSPAKRSEKIKAIKEIITARQYRDAVAGLPLNHFPPHWRLFFWAAKRGNATILYILLRLIGSLR